MSKPNLIVAFGGVSPEHEVSVITGIQAASAIGNGAYNLVPLYVTKSGRMLTGTKLLDLETYKDLKQAENGATPCAFQVDETGKAVLAEIKAGFFGKPKTIDIDMVLTAFHGAEGENGSFQGMCEMLNIPYTGSGPLASSVGMDKQAAKNTARSLGIPVVDDVVFSEHEWVEHRDEILSRIGKLRDLVFVKPVHLGSSIGVQKAKGRDAVIRAVESGFRYDDLLIVEKAISPLIEINCSVLGGPDDATASVCEQPIGREELLSFEDKYMGEEGKGMASATRLIPAPISEKLTGSIQETSVRLFKAMRASGVARLDFLVEDGSEKFYFNEINTIPGSFSFYLWEKSGIGFKQLLEKLIEGAKNRHKIKNGRARSYETNLLSQKAVKGLKSLKGKG